MPLRIPTNLQRIALLTAVTASVLAGIAAAPAQATTYGFGGADSLKSKLEALRAGDVLYLSPGTYEIGGIAPVLASGTAASRIVVRASDAANPPVLRGRLVLTNANYWTVNGIKIQATRPNEGAFSMVGGTGWVVQNGEFWGARQTKAFDNVSIANNGSTPPSNWLFTTNCIHDAGDGSGGGTHSPTTDHNLYMIAQGSAPGRISRNIMFGAYSGANIKIGYGGVPGAVGASDVITEYNTLINSGMQMFMNGTLHNDTVRKNLFQHSTGPNYVGLYISALTGGSTNGSDIIATDNYGAATQAGRADMVHTIWQPDSAREQVTNSGNIDGTDAFLSAGGCDGGLRPGNPTAANYGRYAP